MSWNHYSISSRNIWRGGSNFDYTKSFDTVSADNYYERLKEEIVYVDEQPLNSIHYVGYGDSGVSYRVAETQIDAKPWPTLLLELRDFVHDKSSVQLCPN
jgi:hypothetical protein